LNNIDSKVLGIALPLILSNITIPLVGLVDNLVVGHLGSSIYIGAIGIGSIIISYILFSFGFIKSVTTGQISQSSGSGNFQKLFSSLYQISFIAFLISSLIIISRTYIIDTSLYLMEASSTVKDNSKIYLDYRIWSVPAIFMRDILIGYLIGVQKARMAMVIVIFINILNIILDFYFVYHLNMKIEGVAIASLIAEYSVIFFVFYIFYKDNFLKYFDLSNIFDWLSIKGKLIINFDMFIRSLILMTCFAYFVSTGASYGNTTLAANTILLNFFFIYSYAIDGFAHASEALVGEAYGKKNKRNIYAAIFATGKFSLYLSIIFILILVTSSDLIIKMITNLDLVQLDANLYLKWLLFIFIFGTIAFWLDGVFIGLLFTKIMRNIMIASGIFFIVFEQLIFKSNNEGLWISFLIFFIIRSVLLSYSLYRGIRKNMYV
tara:strand:- start:80 stop:1381 length:1302 start_codon:yes stop_codon:yes gene_type:complete